MNAKQESRNKSLRQQTGATTFLVGMIGDDARVRIMHLGRWTDILIDEDGKIDMLVEFS